MSLRQNQDTLDEETKQMSRKRKKYTLEFKREAVQLWESSGKSAAENEKDLGISTGLIYRWKRRLNQKAAAEADGSAAESAEIRRLRRELELVRQERDILIDIVGFRYNRLAQTPDSKMGAMRIPCF